MHGANKVTGGIKHGMNRTKQGMRETKQWKNGAEKKKRVQLGRKSLAGNE